MAAAAAMEERSPAVPLDEELLFTTVWIVGLPVEAQVRDGSLYSGLFHTASFHDGYGVILKKARKIGQGKCDTNIAIGALIDTLVILSSDLVQIVVKEFVLPAEGIVGNVAGDSIKTATGAIEPRGCSTDLEGERNSLKFGNDVALEIERKSPSSSNVVEDGKLNKGNNVQEVLTDAAKTRHKVEDSRQNSEHREKLQIEESSLIRSIMVEGRQVEEDSQKEEENSCCHIDETYIANMNLQEVIPKNACLPQLAVVQETQADISLKTTSDGTICGSPAALPPSPYAEESELAASVNFPSSDAHSLVASTPYTSVSDNKSSTSMSHSESPSPSVPKSNSVSNMNAKEFKLNPCAKAFTPSFANYRSVPAAMPTLAKLDSISNSRPVVPVAVGQPGNEISSSANNLSLPSKLVQYNNLVPGPGGTGSPYSRPIVAPAYNRQQPVRFADQYHPVQPVPPFVRPNSQSVMAGRWGHLVYVQPIAQDATQRTTVFSQGIPHPVLTPHHTNVSKLQATQPLQLCMNPPLMAGVNQHFAVPSHIPFSQPLPAIQPITVPGADGFPGSKFQ